jgi:hypothetical protein
MAYATLHANQKVDERSISCLVVFFKFLYKKFLGVGDKLSKGGTVVLYSTAIRDF